MPVFSSVQAPSVFTRNPFLKPYFANQIRVCCLLTPPCRWTECGHDFFVSFHRARNGCQGAGWFYAAEGSFPQNWRTHSLACSQLARETSPSSSGRGESQSTRRSRNAFSQATGIIAGMVMGNIRIILALPVSRVCRQSFSPGDRKVPQAIPSNCASLLFSAATVALSARRDTRNASRSPGC